MGCVTGHMRGVYFPCALKIYRNPDLMAFIFLAVLKFLVYGLPVDPIRCKHSDVNAVCVFILIEWSRHLPLEMYPTDISRVDSSLFAFKVQSHCTQETFYRCPFISFCFIDAIRHQDQ